MFYFRSCAWPSLSDAASRSATILALLPSWRATLLPAWHCDCGHTVTVAITVAVSEPRPRPAAVWWWRQRPRRLTGSPDRDLWVLRVGSSRQPAEFGADEPWVRSLDSTWTAMACPAPRNSTGSASMSWSRPSARVTLPSSSWPPTSSHRPRWEREDGLTGWLRRGCLGDGLGQMEETSSWDSV